MSLAPDLSKFTKEEIRDVLDTVRQPVNITLIGSDNFFNSGAVIRTCHNFLVNSITLVDCPKFYEGASLGTQKYEHIIHVTLDAFVANMRLCREYNDNPYIVFERRADLKTEYLQHFVYPIDPEPNLVFGSEKTGIPDEVLALSRYKVSIPQYGIHNDMNLSVAVGIALYDWTVKNGK